MLKKLKGVSAVNVVLSVVFLVCQYFIYFNVRLGRDDYLYIHFSKNVFSSVGNYYIVGNGRLLVNFIESLFMKFDGVLLAVANPLIMLLLSYLMYKLANKITGCGKHVYAYILVAIAVIDMTLSAEIFYWFSGSVTYLFSSVMFVAFLLSFTYLRDYTKRSNGKNAALVAVCVLSALFMEQYSLMIVGFLTFVFACDLIKTKKVKPLYLILYILCVLAMASVVIAPANFVRLQNNSGSGFSLGSLKTTLMDSLFFAYHSSSAMRFVAALCSLEVIVFIKSKKYFGLILSIIESVVVIAISFLKMEVFVLALFGFAVFVASTVCVLKIIAKSKFEFFCTVTLLVVALLSQAFMLVDTMHGITCFRLSCTLIMTYILLSTYLLARFGNMRNALIVVSVMLLFVNLYAGTAACAVSALLIIFCKENKITKAFTLIVSAGVISLSLISNGVSIINLARLYDINESLLRSGKEEITVYSIPEQEEEKFYFFSIMTRCRETDFDLTDNYSVFCCDYNGNLMREYYGLNDNQTVRHEKLDDYSQLDALNN